MESRQDYATNGTIFAFFGTGSDVADCDWRTKFRKMEMFFVFVVTTRLFDKALCTITAKEHNFRLLLFNINVQNVGARVSLQTFVTVFITFIPCLDIHKLFREQNLPRQ